jgi:pimeloyl-ACP methyl ester carboxylesterase
MPVALPELPCRLKEAGPLNKPTMTTYSSHIIPVNQIELHYIHYQHSAPSILLMHGLTANAHAFDGLINAGLHENFNIYSVDLRGRGLSSKTAFHYSIQDHAKDIIQLLDHLHIETISVCGHSFGGLLSTYLAYHYPDRFINLIILDAAPKMNPKTPEMLGPALSRLDTVFPSFDVYIEKVKQAPYLTFWDPAMESYYKADVATAADGSVEPRSNLADILQIATHSSKEPWDTYFTNIPHRALMVNAVDHYTLNQPLLPDFLAEEATRNMKQASYWAMQGNHQTMLYGPHANELVTAMNNFLL